MRNLLLPVGGSAALLFAFALTPPEAAADQSELCIVCSQPAQTYRCRVDTANASPGKEALRLYCIFRTAKDGSHKSCAAQRNADSACEGPVKAYSYAGPEIPEKLRSTVRKMRENRTGDDRFGDNRPADAPLREDGPPETLVEMGSRAVDAGRQGVRSTGGAVRDVTGSTGRAIGKVGKTAGEQVGRTVRGAGSAARFTYDCVLSLFTDCLPTQSAEESANEASPRR
jgi:hypothetical protein